MHAQRCVPRRAKLCRRWRCNGSDAGGGAPGCAGTHTEARAATHAGPHTHHRKTLRANCPCAHPSWGGAPAPAGRLGHAFSAMTASVVHGGAPPYMTAQSGGVRVSATGCATQHAGGAGDKGMAHPVNAAAGQRVCARVCARVCVRARTQMCVTACAHTRTCVCACVCVCVRARAADQSGAHHMRRRCEAHTHMCVVTTGRKGASLCQHIALARTQRTGPVQLCPHASGRCGAAHTECDLLAMVCCAACAAGPPCAWIAPHTHTHTRVLRVPTSHGRCPDIA